MVTACVFIVLSPFLGLGWYMLCKLLSPAYLALMTDVMLAIACLSSAMLIALCLFDKVALTGVHGILVLVFLMEVAIFFPGSLSKHFSVRC